MSDVAITNQLPSRTSSSTRWPRKWSTLGGRSTSTSTTVIPTNDTDAANETPSKTNGHHRHSTSLLRKASTISRSNGTPAAADEISSPSLKKSRSLMNVLRSKLNSPAVIRRFRSKSRENHKQTVIEVNGHSTNERSPSPPAQQVKQTNDEEVITTRKSRKRDPSPMRRLANRISQLTRHQSTTAYERQKKSPTKSATNDAISKTPSPTHNKDKVDHINACYDEIRAKYFNKNNSTQRNSTETDHQNRSLLSNDTSTDSPRVPSPILPDDPLLQARKQANLKLNCLLSGYTLTTPFSAHEKSFGRNDLFKFNHYYDVGKRKYDWNSTNANNQLFSSLRARPISKSIDSFRPLHAKEDEVPITLEKMNFVDNDRLVRTENHQEDVTKVLTDNNTVIDQQDHVLNKSETNSSNSYVTQAVPVDNNTCVTSITTNSIDLNENNTTVTDRDEEFEQNFLRAVDRALGVVNKEEKHVTQPVIDKSIVENQSALDLVEMTERALSSINNLPDILSNGSNTKEQESNANNAAPISSEVIDSQEEFLNNEQPLKSSEVTMEELTSIKQSPVITEDKHEESVNVEPTLIVTEEKHEEPVITEQPPTNMDENRAEPNINEQSSIIVEDEKHDDTIFVEQPAIVPEEKHDELPKAEETPVFTEDKHAEPDINDQSSIVVVEEKHDDAVPIEQSSLVPEEKHDELPKAEETPVFAEEKYDEPSITEQPSAVEEDKHDNTIPIEPTPTVLEEKHDEPSTNEQSPVIVEEKHEEPTIAEQPSANIDEKHEELTKTDEISISAEEKHGDANDIEQSPIIIEDKHEEPITADQRSISAGEKHDELITDEQSSTIVEEKHNNYSNVEQSPVIIEEKHDEPITADQLSISTEENHNEPTNVEQPAIIEEEKHEEFINTDSSLIVNEEKHDSEQSSAVTEEKHIDPLPVEQPTIAIEKDHVEPINSDANNEEISSLIEDLVQKTEHLLVEECK
ncbi:unnamed protein product, partial [Adineta ricciae]